MTITVDLRPEVQAELARQAAARGVEAPAYVAALLEKAAVPSSPELQDQPARPKRQRPPGRKSLVELFAESPLRGLDLDFSRNKSTGRPVDL